MVAVFTPQAAGTVKTPGEDGAAIGSGKLRCCSPEPWVRTGEKKADRGADSRGKGSLSCSPNTTRVASQ